MKSDTVRWLIDAENGGPPKAFLCILAGSSKTNEPTVAEFYPCGVVTRTLRGMHSHQRSVHGFKAQKELWAKENRLPQAFLERK